MELSKLPEEAFKLGVRGAAYLGGIGINLILMASHDMKQDKPQPANIVYFRGLQIEGPKEEELAA